MIGRLVVAVAGHIGTARARVSARAAQPLQTSTYHALPSLHHRLDSLRYRR